MLQLGRLQCSHHISLHYHIQSGNGTMALAY
jgi:hypothetical protein